MEKETPRCKRCFGPHWTNTCTEEEKCLACKLPGHRRGDPSCPKIIEEFEGGPDRSEPSAKDTEEPGPERAESEYMSADEAGDEMSEDEEEEDENSDEEGEHEPNAIEEHVTSKKDETNGEKSGNKEEKKDIHAENKNVAVNVAKLQHPSDQKRPGRKPSSKDQKKGSESKSGATPATKAQGKDAQSKQQQQQQQQEEGRGRTQYRLDSYYKQHDRSSSKRRASKSPLKSNIQDSKLRRVNSQPSGNRQGGK